MDIEVISRKLSQLQEYVDELKAATDISWDTFRSDLRARAFVERYLHLALEEVLDIANHLVSLHQWREPRSYRDLLLILSEKGVIPGDQLQTFQNMASFRNMLVHRYETIESELVYGVFSRHLSDFDLYASYIVQWIRKQGQ